MVILAPEDSEINVSGGPSRGWDKLVIRFLPGRYLIIGKVLRRDIPLAPNRWSLFAPTGHLSRARSVDVTNDAEIIAILRESFVVPRVSHVVVAAPSGLYEWPLFVCFFFLPFLFF